LLQHYAADSQPFTYIDGHAGRGIYDLGENLTEFQNYGLNLLERHHHRLSSGTPAAVASLLEANRRLNGPNETRWYLGSPSLATCWIRQQDRMTALEASQEHQPALEAAFGRTLAADGAARRVDIRRENSYLYLSDLSVAGRGLILLDPPYEPYSQYLSWNLWAIDSLRSRCPDTCILMWYPCSGEADRQSLHLRVRDLGLQNAVFAELCETDFGKKKGALVSSGVLLVNPPTDMLDLEAKVQEILSCLQDAFHPVLSMETSYLKV
ncbi:rlmJ, partial [Symbiodinium necroappetens]